LGGGSWLLVVNVGGLGGCLNTRVRKRRNRGGEGRGGEMVKSYINYYP